MKVLVMGAGAIGGVFGGLLAKSGHEVTLVGRPKIADSIRDKGLFVRGLFGDAHITGITAYDTVDDIRDSSFDLVLISVKSYDTQDAANLAKPFVSDDALVVSLQNGLGNYEVLKSIYGPQRAVAGRVIFGAMVPEPGTVEVTVYAEPVMIGSPSNAVNYQGVQAIADAFAEAGIPSEPTLEIDKFIWAKMLYNCSLNPLSAILRVPYGTLLETDSSKDTIVHIVEEIFSVARAKKVKLFWDNASEYIDVLFNRLVPDTAAHQSSMLQDIRAGRRTEIDAMNGAVASLGEEAGVACPVNWTITKIIQSLQTQQFK